VNGDCELGATSIDDQPARGGQRDAGRKLALGATFTAGVESEVRGSCCQHCKDRDQYGAQYT
jgi:hypothetical protein